MQIMVLNKAHNFMLSITLRQLEYAVAIARAGSVTAAAAMVHISQPALSNALAQLEQHLGQRLFLRRAGGPMVATAFGRVWLAEAEGALGALARLSRGQIRAEPLRLAVFQDLAPVLLPAVLSALGQTGSAPALRPLVLGFEALSDALDSGQADLALTWALGLSRQVAQRVLANVPPHAVLPPDHPLAAKASLCLADLAGHALVLTDQGLSVQHMQALFTHAGLAANLAHRVATPDLMRGYAARGFGIGLAYSHPQTPFAPDGAPLCLRPVTDAGQVALVLAWRAGEALPLTALQSDAIARHFDDWFSNRFEPRDPWAKAP